MFEAYCDLKNGGYTVLQRRIDDHHQSSKYDTIDFNREWAEYLMSNIILWAGLDKTHTMTGNGIYGTHLHIYNESFENESREAMYSSALHFSCFRNIITDDTL